ncbi:hypothetical protein EJ05DRAFT_97994 [Pseudovirgaria hyperparasitica]|uniref:Uncharacterized protein n=1 Tax=Pseudovirgaria hyperparasitica TaxID=470096 RepID=A0A6A6W2R1_9PEZI|nr:uncharacterized protein EJ05DRAFT_97994 [Pseudovirgaria hyperparasitica]KAF2755321.1 hypothetical protein EJ05DRAFT_97994 [Pseudovirgaria hyperparasitica]
MVVEFSSMFYVSCSIRTVRILLLASDCSLLRFAQARILAHNTGNHEFCGDVPMSSESKSSRSSIPFIQSALGSFLALLLRGIPWFAVGTSAMSFLPVLLVGSVFLSFSSLLCHSFCRIFALNTWQFPFCWPSLSYF